MEGDLSGEGILRFCVSDWMLTFSLLVSLLLNLKTYLRLVPMLLDCEPFEAFFIQSGHGTRTCVFDLWAFSFSRKGFTDLNFQEM